MSYYNICVQQKSHNILPPSLCHISIPRLIILDQTITKVGASNIIFIIMNVKQSDSVLKNISL